MVMKLFREFYILLDFIKFFEISFVKIVDLYEVKIIINDVFSDVFI